MRFACVTDDETVQREGLLFPRHDGLTAPDDGERLLATSPMHVVAARRLTGESAMTAAHSELQKH